MSVPQAAIASSRGKKSSLPATTVGDRLGNLTWEESDFTILSKTVNASVYQSSPNTPVRIGFSFINIDNRENVERIIDPESRRKIRAHVMRRQRATEAEQGIVRPTGRPPAKENKRRSTRGVETPSKTPSLSEETSTESEESFRSSASSNLDLPASRQESVKDTLAAMTLVSRFGNQQINPFGTIFGGADGWKRIDALLLYYCETVVPMLYHMETEVMHEKRRKMILLGAESESATWVAFLAVLAAYRVVERAHRRGVSVKIDDDSAVPPDRDYYFLKDKALSKINTAISQHKKLDPSIIEACVALMAAASLLGLFSEARQHLKGLAHSISNRKDIVIGEWASLTDNKISLALHTKPLFPIQKRLEIVPPDLVNRIPKDHLPELGLRFRSVDKLKPQLLTILDALVMTTKFYECIALDPSTSSPAEQEYLRETAIETEHQLIDYTFEASLPITEMEALVCLGAIGVLGLTVLRMLRSAGVCRALDIRHKAAIQSWFTRYSHNTPDIELDLVIWLLFTSIQCAEGHPEERYFISKLHTLVERKGWTEWRQVEASMLGFLYIPRRQRGAWTRIWREVNGFHGETLVSPQKFDIP